jgi:hypothetical protein
MSKAYDDAQESMYKTFCEFESEFIALQQKYPEFHLSFWNHADYLEALEAVQSDLHDAYDWDGLEDENGDAPEFEFRAPDDMVSFCHFMSEYLLENFDAANGINWGLLKDAAADYMGDVTT